MRLCLKVCSLPRLFCTQQIDVKIFSQSNLVKSSVNENSRNWKPFQKAKNCAFRIQSAILRVSISTEEFIAIVSIANWPIWCPKNHSSVTRHRNIDQGICPYERQSWRKSRNDGRKTEPKHWKIEAIDEAIIRQPAQNAIGKLGPKVPLN